MVSNAGSGGRTSLTSSVTPLLTSAVLTDVVVIGAVKGGGWIGVRVRFDCKPADNSMKFFNPTKHLIVSKLRVSQVSVGMLAYRCCDDS